MELGLLVVVVGQAWLVWRLWMRALRAEDERDELRADLMDADNLRTHVVPQAVPLGLQLPLQ